MTKYREILRLNAMGISQVGIAKSCQCCRKTVRKVLKTAEEKGIQWPLESNVTDEVLLKTLRTTSTEEKVSENEIKKKLPDLEYIHKELMKNGVSLRLLWTEYYEECRAKKEDPLMYSRFCFHYQKFAENKRATMHILRKPAEQIEVDWAGTTGDVIDRDTGELIPVYFFVGSLSYSCYTYVEGFFSMNMESWISAHVNMFEFFGGVSKILIPDNLKTGVNKTEDYIPEINKTYREMSEHYGTAIIPARIRKPKDKATVEGSVGNITTWIIAALRKQQFFSLSELNREVKKKLDEVNRKPFQKREGSRLNIFLGEEKPLLLKLPPTPFELATWKIATVQFNYHISVDKMHYSVPHKYIKNKVDVRITKNIIEIFFQGSRIASHRKLYGAIGQYSTIDTHMPENHNKFLQWNAERFIAWAEKIGPYTSTTIKSILTSQKVEQQGYKSCMGLLKLSEKFSSSRLEAACKKVCTYTINPNYKNVKIVLESGQDKNPESSDKLENKDANEFEFVRGASYYGGKKYDK